MRNLLFISAIVALLATSCDMINTIDDVSIPVDYSASYDVTATSDSILLDKTFSLPSDPKVNAMKDKISDVKLDSIVLVVDNYVGESGNKLNGKLGYSEITSDICKVFTNISNFELSNGSKLKLIIPKAEIENVQSILLQQNSIKINLKGKADLPATFTINAKFYISLKADALKK